MVIVFAAGQKIRAVIRRTRPRIRVIELCLGATGVCRFQTHARSR